MKNLINLGRALNTVEQKEIFGGGGSPGPSPGSGGWINPFNCNTGIYEPCPAFQTRTYNPGSGECECA
jgi:hypothetical protein